MTPRLAGCLAAFVLLVSGARAAAVGGTIASNLKSIEAAAVLGGAQVRSDPSPPSQQSTCTGGAHICWNQYASGYDAESGDYIIRANISEVSLTFGKIADRRAVLIFTMTQDPDTKKWVPILDVQVPSAALPPGVPQLRAGTPSPWCWQADCYAEFHTKDPNVAALSFFWVATLDKANHVLFSAAGWPSS
jgi:hypothetical protein